MSDSDDEPNALSSILGSENEEEGEAEISPLWAAGAAVGIGLLVGGGYLFREEIRGMCVCVCVCRGNGWGGCCARTLTWACECMSSLQCPCICFHKFLEC